MRLDAGWVCWGVNPCSCRRHSGPLGAQIVLGLTAVAAGAYGLQRIIAPYAREYYERWAAAAARKRTADPAAGGAPAGKLSPKEQTAASALADAIKVYTPPPPPSLPSCTPAAKHGPRSG